MFDAPTTPLVPSKNKVLFYKIFLFLFGWFFRFLLSLKFNKITIKGLEHLASKGPKLVLMNHSCPLDPLLLIFFSKTPMQFLIADMFTRQKLMGFIAYFFGQIPKKKLDGDLTPIRTLKAWCDVGATVALFPEGKFSWDGSPCPLMPGIEQLIHFLNVPVVTVNLSNGHKVKPAWATFYRKTSIHLEIYPPIQFKKNDSIQDIIKSKIFASPLHAAISDFDAQGQNLSFGLKKHLRFCPKCFSENTISEKNDDILCSHCGTSFHVTASNHIKGLDSIKNIEQLFKHVLNFIDTLWNENTILKSLHVVSLTNVTTRHYHLLSQGYLILDKEKISIGEFNLKFADIQQVTMDWDDHIIIKNKQARYALQLPHDSRMLFMHLLQKVTKCI
jgi:1-acyl-sn-glycerol-3-phosphate acyltransferase